MPANIINKRCSQCKKYKSYSKFYSRNNSSDGFRYECKACGLEEQRRFQSSDRGREYMREYMSRPSSRRKSKEYRRSKKGKEVHRQSKLRQYKLYPEKLKAKRAVNHAVETGKLIPIRKRQCECGSKAENYHHYKGYEKKYWLSVIPVCRPCHQIAHAHPHSAKFHLASLAPPIPQVKLGAD